PLTKEVAWSQNCHDCLFTAFANHRELHAALLHVHDTLRVVTLRVDNLCFLKLFNSSRQSGRIEKSLCIKCSSCSGVTIGFCAAGTHRSFHNATPNCRKDHSPRYREDPGCGIR